MEELLLQIAAKSDPYIAAAGLGGAILGYGAAIYTQFLNDNLFGDRFFKFISFDRESRKTSTECRTAFYVFAGGVLGSIFASF